MFYLVFSCDFEIIVHFYSAFCLQNKKLLLWKLLDVLEATQRSTATIFWHLVSSYIGYFRDKTSIVRTMGMY